jgi:hypothetical protein
MSAINGGEYFARIAGTTQCSHVWMTDGLNPTRCATCGVLSPPPCITTLVAALPNVHRTYTQAEMDAAIAAERARVVITPKMFRAALIASWNPDERIYDDAAAIAHLNAALTAAPRGTTTEEG